MIVSPLKVAVVLVSYNSEEDIEACVRSIPRIEGLTILVVDNNSTDRSPQILENLAERGLIDWVFKSPTNLGFAKAVNLAIATTENCDILLFNPDARMDDGCLERLIVRSNEDRSVGILSPVVYSGNSVRTMTAGRQPRVWPMFTHFSGLSGLLPKMSLFEGRQLFLKYHAAADRKVEWVAGCCMYIKSRVIQEIGPLSERWFMYGEDVEYCKRATDAGFEILLVHDARCYHEMGASVIKAPREINTMWPRNLYDYYKKEYRPNVITRTSWRLIFTAGMLARSIMFYVKGKRRNDVEQLSRSNRFWAFAMAIWRPVT